MSKYNFLLLILCILISCKDDISRIIDNQEELIRLSQNKDIINDNYREYNAVTTYKEGGYLENIYLFKKEARNKNSYSFIGDTIQFTPDSIIGIDSRSDEYKNKLCAYYQKASKVLELYNIRALNGRKYSNHPSLELTILLNNGEILEYRPKARIMLDKDLGDYKEVSDGWYLFQGNSDQ